MLRTDTPLTVALEELHNPNTGRIDASRVAEFLAVPLTQVASALEASYPAVHKTPDASSLQRRLAPWKRVIELVSHVTRDRREALAWLNNPHPDLGEDTPLQVMLNGRVDAVVTLVDNALAGLPS
jgi:uncharacterized protein (DUF2384 family)